jgi:hypothetical protein
LSRINVRFKSAREILSPETRVNTEWIAKPWLARNAITELVGKAKVAGKTTWVLALCAAILDGNDFMGLPTSKTGIVYLTEQSEVTFRLSLERAHIGQRDDLEVLFWHETLGKQWPDVMDEAIGIANARGAGLLVVDTLAQFAKLTGDRENNAGDALEAVFPLQKARDQNLGVLPIRHERKEGGQLGDSGRGSSAFAGAVDTILTLGRPRGNQRETMRCLDGISRLDEVPSHLMIELCAEGYRSHGTTEEPASDAAKELVSIILPGNESEAVSLEQVIDSTSQPRATVQRVLCELKGKEQMIEVGRGVKGDPYRYYPRNDSAQNPSL